MGKSIIIPGADFSANAITRITKEWYTPDPEQYLSVVSTDGYLIDSTMTGVSCYFMTTWENELSGKTINILKTSKNPEVEGSLILKRISTTDGTIKRSVTVPINLEGYNEYSFQPITISENETIGVIASVSRAAMRYSSTSITPSLGVSYQSFVAQPYPFGAANHTWFEIQFGRLYD